MSESLSVLVVAQWVGRDRCGLIPRRTTKRKDVWMSGKQEEWYMVGVVWWGFARGNVWGVALGMNP